MKMYVKIFDYLPRNTKTVFATVLLSTITLQDKQNMPETEQDNKIKTNITAFNVIAAENLMRNTYVIKNFQHEQIKPNKLNEEKTSDSINNVLPIEPVKKSETKIPVSAEKIVSKADSEVKIIAGKKSVKYIYKDGTVEIREGGTLPWRNKNPGALRTSDKSVGRANKFAIFASEEEGMVAMKALLRSDKYCNLSLKSAIFKYAPPHENNTKKYQSDLKKYTGLDIDKKLRDLNEEELELVAQTIKRLEGWVPGKLTRIEPQKQIIDTLVQKTL